MIRFRVLGTVELEDGNGIPLEPVLRRPKLLALLTYLAIARPAGFRRRDALVALLWPELDHAHARNALRQAVHSLRAELGEGVLLSRGEEELGLAADRFRCDVGELATATAAGTPDVALALYRGPLLDGFHLPGAPEFERWLELEREHWHRQVREAAQLLCARERAAGRPAGAARVAARMLELSPHDEVAVRELMLALEAAGDRAGAVRAYDEFERRLGSEMELEPSAGLESLVRRIRSAAPGATAPAPPGPPVASAEADNLRGASPPVPAPLPPGRAARTGTSWLRSPIPLAAGGLLMIAWLFVQAYADDIAVPETAGAGRIVVLPFENLGPAEDRYLADGIAEEIAVRLATVAPLRVLGEASARRYAGTVASSRRIRAELGVDFILRGTVRWHRPAAGPARARIALHLVNAADDSRLWGEVYEATMEELFDVQSEIARKVAHALGVTVADPRRGQPDVVPTRSAAAYEFYLRGNEYMARGHEERVTRSALRLYERAVESDTAFALAYSRLSRMHSRMYWFHFDRSPERLARARAAADRALALDPALPEAHLALGAYHFMAHLDYERALAEFALVEKSRPYDTQLLQPRAVMRVRQGDFAGALADFEKALSIDPASGNAANNAAQAYDLLRRYARAEALYDRAIALLPEWALPYHWKLGVQLRSEGSTRKAREVLESARAVGATVHPLLVLSEVRLDLMDGRHDTALLAIETRVPETIQDQLLVLPRPLLRAEALALMNRVAESRANFDSARAILEAAVAQWPEDSRLHGALGIAYAGVGRRQDAVRAGRRALELMPIERDALRGYYRAWELARIETMVGDHDAAIDRLTHLLSIPGHLTPAWLRIDPSWNALRDDPRFVALPGR